MTDPFAPISGTDAIRCALLNRIDPKRSPTEGMGMDLAAFLDEPRCVVCRWPESHHATRCTYELIDDGSAFPLHRVTVGTYRDVGDRK